MHCKIFHSKRHEELDAKINDWLDAHPRIWFPMPAKFTTCLLAEEAEYILEHTLILFYSTPDEQDPFVADEDEEEKAVGGAYIPGAYIPSDHYDQMLSRLEAEQRAGIL